MIQENHAEALYYGYSDYLGSLVALTDETGNVVERYAYDPWGRRRNPNNWTQDDTRTGWIVNRGYTGHEHLDAFGIINMNGRVYDPLTAQFFSPDPYIQAPDNWLNYNRYAYAYGNSFKYTDPSGELQIGPFYISLNLGWGYGNGFYFGVSAGLGIENVAYIGISLGYNTSGSFSFSANAGIAGFYVSGGYDTKGGWNASAGWSAPIPSLGIVSFNTNLLSTSANYSQHGGWSYNHMGMSFSKNGGSFSPSVGIGINQKIGTSISELSEKIGVVYKDDAQISTNQELDDMLNRNGVDISDYYAMSIDIENELPNILTSRGYKRIAGIIFKTKGDVGGVTVSYYRLGKKPYSEIYLSTHNTNSNLMKSLNHEFIHSWQWAKFGYKMNDWESFKEASAYRYTQLYYPTITVPQYRGPAFHRLYLWPVLPSIFPF